MMRRILCLLAIAVSPFPLVQGEDHMPPPLSPPDCCASLGSLPACGFCPVNRNRYCTTGNPNEFMHCPDVIFRNDAWEIWSCEFRSGYAMYETGISAICGYERMSCLVDGHGCVPVIPPVFCPVIGDFPSPLAPDPDCTSGNWASAPRRLPTEPTS